MNGFISPVELSKAFRLINHGPTTLVSARHAGVDNVMAASWVCSLDYSPPRLTVVLDKMAKTRELIENDGYFVVQIPTVAQLELTHHVGTRSLNNDPDKMAYPGIKFFEIPDYDLPFIQGCSGWLACKLLAEPHNQQAYDLFIGEIIGAWADNRAFDNGRWKFESADPSWRSLHYIAGGQFYAIGEGMKIGGAEMP
ncbi:flavin reductase family protein [Citrobacter freundii]|uniref:flavin reductase family protein n=1 Tax=Citrobacter TaxID=544 RepID=UPI00214DEDF4|nr:MULTISPECIES: flavin reductase family protein [Citrobacter]MCR3713746.1 flavin reductase family protein [Citrobacter freundii]MDM3231786.1 flavin reductase family protein [Citrobacter sp. Cf078]